MRMWWLLAGLVAAVVLLLIGLFAITPTVNAQSSDYWKDKGAYCTVGDFQQAEYGSEGTNRTPDLPPVPRRRWDDGKCQLGDFGCNHKQEHDWYRSLKQPGTGYSCCSGDVDTGDCRPTRAFYNEAGDYWTAMIDGHWAVVPRNVVIKDPTLNQDGVYAHICAAKSGMIYCFIGAGSAR